MADPHSTTLQILDLEASAGDRSSVLIDGGRYELRRVGDLTVRQSLQVEGHMTALARLMAPMDVAPDRRDEAASDDEIDDRLTSLCGLVLDAPSKTLETLSSHHRLQVVMAFQAVSTSAGNAVASAPIEPSPAQTSAPEPWDTILPRLSRFFGGDPWDWWDRYPLSLVNSYLRMAPRIEAKEALLYSSVVAVGTGSAKEPVASSLLQQWRREAWPTGPRASLAPVKPTAAALERLATRGYGLRKVPTQPISAQPLTGGGVQ